MTRDRGKGICIEAGGIIPEPPETHGIRDDYMGYGRGCSGADSKSAGGWGRMEYSTSNTLRHAQLGKKGTKDA